MIKDKAYWEAKHPIVDQTYDGRPLPNGRSFKMDVRNFIWDHDVELQEVIKFERLMAEDVDGTAGKIQAFVCKILQYVGDESIGRSEYWLFPGETYAMRKGDCEDGAILMASLLTMALPKDDRWRVNVSAGWVQQSPTAPRGGHAYCTYCRVWDNEWVVLDWCYFADPTVPMQIKPLLKTVTMYKDVWFSFNRDHARSHMAFDLRGRLRARVRV